MFLRPLLVLGILLAAAQAKVQFLGVGIAGGDFGCTIDGTCRTSQVQLPLSSLGGGDGQGQMRHFVQNDGVNLFRLPVSWQFLVNNKLGGTLDSTNLGKYDQVVQACLAAGATCMIDIHNFARWNGGIIGQGGPSDDDFVSLWRQLAAKYASNEKIVFELMNEPHDLDIGIWAQTCQKVVTAIRAAGATKQTILLPGTNFDSAATLVSSGSADALMAIRNPDGTTAGLVLDIHKYLDVDNSGTHTECTTDNRDAFGTVAAYLRSVGRKGFVSETGASGSTSCLAAFCSQNAIINENADVFLGLVGWGAGSFSTSYIMSLTPTKNGNTFVDNALMTQCMVNTWLNAKTVAPRPPPQPLSPSSPAVSAPSPTASSSALVPAPPKTTLTPTKSSGAGSELGKAGKPTLVDTTMIIGSQQTGNPNDDSIPTTLLVAGGTPTKKPYSSSPTNSVLSNGSSSASSSSSSKSPPSSASSSSGVSSPPPPVPVGSGGLSFGTTTSASSSGLASAVVLALLLL